VEEHVAADLAAVGCCEWHVDLGKVCALMNVVIEVLLDGSDSWLSADNSAAMGSGFWF